MKIDSLSSMQIGGPEYHRLRKADEERGAAAASGDLAVKTSFGPILEKSLRFVPDEAVAVEQARQALAAGELDSPEAIRDAAEKLLRQGI